MSDDGWVPWHKRSSENAERFREIQRESRARYRARNEEEINRKKREYVAANPDKISEQNRASRERNWEKRRAQEKEYYTNNKGLFRAHDYARKRGIRHVLSWKFRTAIEAFYKEARKLTEETGVLHVVDHIWPINGEDSCGLHVEWNLRVITQAENDSKGNKRPDGLVLDMEVRQWLKSQMRLLRTTQKPTEKT